MEELIKVTGLTKSYENSPAVSDLSFSVKKGEIVGLLGPNGAGKSTTINILATVLKPDSGNISICGYNLQNEKNKIITYKNMGGKHGNCSKQNKQNKYF